MYISICYVYRCHSSSGVEPWYFYFINGLLNFNVVFILALLSLMVVEFQVLNDLFISPSTYTCKLTTSIVTFNMDDHNYHDHDLYSKFILHSDNYSVP